MAICLNCGKEYTIPKEGNWKKDGSVGKAHGSSDSKRFCCFKCGQEYSQAKRKGKWVSPFANSEVRQKAKDTIRQKYNCDNVFQNKDIKEKIKETNLRKYGEANPGKVKEIKEKIKSTNQDRYGGTLLGSEILRARIRETNLKKYGTEYPQKTEEVKEKQKQTNLKKRGVIAPMMSDEVKQKSIKSIKEHYGVDWNCLSQQCQKAGGIISKINKKWKNDLEAIGLSVELEKNIQGHYNFDLYIPDQNLVIDINPTISHQSTREFKTHFGTIKCRAKDYHQTKLKVALDNSYKCMMIWDWDDRIKILNSLKPKTLLYARQLTLKEVSELDCNIFLNKYHYQNTCKNQTIRLGLYNKDELVQLMTFGTPRYNKKYTYELLRLCTKHEYKVVGGAEKLFKYFITKHNPSTIISYCDLSKFKGQVYTTLGFILDNPGTPNKHWYNTKTRRHITNNLLLQQGYSRLHNDPNYTLASKGDSNETLMINNNYVEVYDCGQATYTWTKE